MDYRHHATDVIAGAIIGVISAWWGYRQYYPPLVSSKSWRPYPARISRETDLPTHGRTASRDDHALLATTNTSNSSPVERPYTGGYPPRQYPEPRFTEGEPGSYGKSYGNGGIVTAPDAGTGGMNQVESSLANNPAFPSAAHSADHSPQMRTTGGL
jgi:diacylglycerol diphosphate phosphatase/phosphatidate phosphatase